MATSINNTSLRIFISSTYEDMKNYREAARDAIIRSEHVPVGMEYFAASPNKPLDACLEDVRTCQLVIILIGMRYGNVDEDTGKSFTELEYEEARKNYIPVIPFFLDEDNGSVTPKHVEIGAGAEKLKVFKERLKAEHRGVIFISAKSLETSVYQSIINQETKLRKQLEIPKITESVKASKTTTKVDNNVDLKSAVSKNISIHIYSNGKKYEGVLVGGKKHGKGTMTWPSGNKYEGDWLDDKRTGKGTMTWSSGEKYEGDYIDDKKTGKGKMVYSYGEYEGDWLDDRMTGKGILTWTSGDRYEGDWLDDKMTGQGTFKSKDGSKYVGQFLDGKLIK